MRVVVQQLAIFLLPILLYAVYLLWRRWRARVVGDPEPPWEQGQWFWAIVAGLVLSIGVFVALSLLDESTPDALFRVPTWKR